MLKRILVATDGSNAAKKALAVAVELAADTSAELVVLNIFDRGDPTGALEQELRTLVRGEVRFSDGDRAL